MSLTYRLLDAGLMYDLPQAAVSVGFEFSDIGAFKITYPMAGINADRLATDKIVIAYDNNGNEIDDGRFRLVAASGEHLTDDADVVSYVGVSQMDAFKRAIVDLPQGTKNVVYSAQNHGYILNNLLTAMQARGVLTGFTWDFTAVNDSSGTIWPYSVNRTYEKGMSLYNIVQSFVDDLDLEVRFQGTVIRAFAKNRMGADRFTIGGPNPVVEFVGGRDYSETPWKRTIEERFHRTVVVGDEGNHGSYTAAGTGPYGIEEQAINQSGTKSQLALSYLAQLQGQKSILMRESLTRRIEMAACPFEPMVDFKTSDWIREKVTGEASLTYRIRAINIQTVPDAPDVCNIVLNDKFLEQAIKLARRINYIGGSVSGSGASTVPPSAPVPDTLAPATPGGLLGTSDVFTQPDGTLGGILFLDWNAPTTNSDGSAITDLKDYRVRYRRKTGDTRWRQYITNDTNATLTGLSPDIIVQSQVQAQDNTGNWSAWSAIIETTIAKDTTPPPQPSPPVLQNFLGTVIIQWNGFGALGESMPLDFAGCRIHASTVNNFTPSDTNAIGAFVSGNRYSSYPASNLVYGVPYYFKFVTYDRSGNQSVASTQSSATPRRLVEDDVSPAGISLASLVPEVRASIGQIFYDDMSDTTRWERVLGAGTFVSTPSAAAKTGSSVGVATNVTWNAHKTLIPYDPGVLYKMTVRVRSNVTTKPAYAGIMGIAADGVTMVNMTGANTQSSQHYVAMSNQTLTGGAVMTEYVGYFKGTAAAGNGVPSSDPKTPATLHDNVRYLRPMLISNIGGAATDVTEWDLVKVEVVPTGLVDRMNIALLAVNSALIENAAIINAKIADLAVTNAKINDLAANKITTAELAVGMRVIAGPEAGSHAEVTANGFYAYALSAIDGVPNLAIRMGTVDNDLFGITNTSGVTVASVNEVGEGSFQKVYSANDPEIMGSPLFGAFANFDSPTEQNDSNPGLLDKLPRGIVATGVYSNINSTTYNTRTALRELSFLAEPGRSYRINMSGSQSTLGSADVTTGFGLAYVNPAAIGGEAPTPTFANTTVLLYSQGTVGVAGRALTLPPNSKALRCNPGGPAVGGELRPGIVKLMFFVTGDLATVNPSSADDIWFWVEDIGPDIPATTVNNFSTVATPQATQPTVKTYTKTWASTASGTYKGDNTKRTDTADVIQGYNSFNGDGDGLWIFPSFLADIGTATIKKIEVFAYANHWYYNSGGTALIKVHGLTAVPASGPAMTTALSSASWPKPGGRWVTLPSSLHAGFKAGTYRGFGMGPSGGTNLLYYGRFNGGTGARMRITYVK